MEKPVALPAMSRVLVLVAAFGGGAAFAPQPAAPTPFGPPRLARQDGALVLASQKTPLQQAEKPGTPIPPSEFATARDLVIASGMSRSFDGAVKHMESELFATITQTRPDLAPDLKKVMRQLAPEFAQQSQSMINNAARIYASALTAKDLKAIDAFFNSPVGKRYVASEPVILLNIEDVMKQWHQNVSVGMMARVRQEMKKRGHSDF